MIENKKFIEGDNAVREFKNKLKPIINSNKTFELRIKEITDKLQKVCVSWNIKGDDRVLSGFNLEASSAFNEMIEKELENIEDKDELNRIKDFVYGVSWLSDTWKSSLRVKIVMKNFKNSRV